MKRILLSVFLSVVVVPVLAFGATWQIDPRSFEPSIQSQPPDGLQG